MTKHIATSEMTHGNILPKKKTETKESFENIFPRRSNLRAVVCFGLLKSKLKMVCFWVRTRSFSLRTSKVRKSVLRVPIESDLSITKLK